MLGWRKIMTRIGIIGMGFVGKAIYSAFKMTDKYDVHGFDIDLNKSVSSFHDAVNSDFVFLCLPSPAREDGSCDTSFIHNFMDRYFEFMTNSSDYIRNDERVFIIKSTIPVGATWEIQQRSNRISENWSKDRMNFVHSPEFLSAKTALHDFLTATRHIVGDPYGAFKDYSLGERVAKLYKERFPNSKIMVMKSDESEFVKYLCNCFFATKISFMNEMYEFAKNSHLDWQTCLDGFLSSGWVSPMHTQVPGPDGKFGYGGACFPKDMKSMLYQMKQKDLVRATLEGAILTNEDVRNA